MLPIAPRNQQKFRSSPSPLPSRRSPSPFFARASPSPTPPTAANVDDSQRPPSGRPLRRTAQSFLQLPPLAYRRDSEPLIPRAAVSGDNSATSTAAALAKSPSLSSLRRKASSLTPSCLRGSRSDAHDDDGGVYTPRAPSSETLVATPAATPPPPSQPTSRRQNGTSTGQFPTGTITWQQRTLSQPTLVNVAIRPEPTLISGGVMRTGGGSALAVSSGRQPARPTSSDEDSVEAAIRDLENFGEAPIRVLASHNLRSQIPMTFSPQFHAR